MVDNSKRCKACDGTGILSDQEGWQYKCSVCNGDGIYNHTDATTSARIMNVDENNRLLD
ncbi:hypothetical protein SAMN05216389_104111 [Oceanobacillus limi]|uniref:Uncharacterized protein n=1 Tax=Oceanobacillus limi TaxID=930131 RepID=A0A1I0AZ79_9BACI|nr:hypothetical protein [Oceanobacillus limi]SES99853.1 hypothetical protein SAMN05216389_104111 [Oceanobacillus limi]